MFSPLRAAVIATPPQTFFTSRALRVLRAAAHNDFERMKTLAHAAARETPLTLAGRHVSDVEILRAARRLGWM